jgi:pyridoxal 5'-phosphate synthase pdxT subunit
MVRIGVLALQGDFAAHARALSRAAAQPVEVRRVTGLDGLSGLVLPGGESTTLLNLMGDEPWFDALARFHREGGHLFGTCAGAILLSREVLHPTQPSLGLLDATIERNAFGRQVDSFETCLPAPPLGGDVEAVFIRAPRFRALGPGVEVLARLGDEPVLVRQDRVLAGTFHPELTGDARLHRYFAALCAAAPAGGERPVRAAAAAP